MEGTTAQLLGSIGLGVVLLFGSGAVLHAAQPREATGITLPLPAFSSSVHRAQPTTITNVPSALPVPQRAKLASLRTNPNADFVSTRAAPLTDQLGPNEIAQLAEHLNAKLSPELRENFDLFIYVSKAEEGSWAQHMYVLVKERSAQPDPKLILLENWAISTGREAMEQAKNGERMSTETPAGIYQFDPDRFFVQYHSSQWQREMPNSMFFNWMSRGSPTGLAIHGVTDADQIAALGRRASAGCVQLPLNASQKLFDLVRDNFEGQVPRFAYDEKTRTVDNKGELARDQNGGLVMVGGYRALVVIENYGGP